jgi:hypothetical protein
MSLRDNYQYEEPTEGGFKVLPKGDYDFTVDEVFAWEESKKGNDMLPICIIVEGQKMNDWLVFVDTVKFKIDAFLKSIFGGPPTVKVDFENTGWLLGRKGRVRLGIVEKPKKGSTTGEMVQFNEIEAYLYDSSKIEGRTVVPAGGGAGGGAARPRPTSQPAAPSPAPAEDFEDDTDVPF